MKNTDKIVKDQASRIARLREKESGMQIEDFKKGMIVYRYGAYNFHGFGMKRYNTRDNDNIVVDDISIEKWKVHSAGRVLMRLVSTEGRMKTSNIYWGTKITREWNEKNITNYVPTEGYFFLNIDDCKQAARKRWEEDKEKRASLVLTERNVHH